MSKSNAKVMLVDDNPVILDILRRGIEPYAEPLAFTDSTTALAQCLANPPDLVICDYWLPDLDARTLLSQLRQIQALKDIKVLVCSAAPKDVVDKVQGEPHFDGFISKPYRLSGLLQAIDEQLALAP